MQVNCEAKLPDYTAEAQARVSDWKQRAKTAHKVVGIRTWHINLNPAAMSSMAFSERGGAPSQVRSGPRADHVDWRGPFATQAGALMVEITTDKGLKGYGLGGGGLAGALVIDHHLKHFVLDRDPLDVEEIWDTLYHITSIYGRRGLVIYALSGVDLALWDLCGKILRAPVYSLITDEPRLSIPAYATGSDVGYYATQGFAACKLPLRNGPDQGTDGFAENLTLVEGARDAVGTDVDLMTDIYLRWDVDYTLRFAEAAAALDIKWIEEPIALDDYEGMGRLVRMLDTTWIVSGEHEFTRYGFRELLRWNAADMIQPDVSWAGGFGECIKIANEAASQGIPTWPHQGGTPWGLHLIACLPMPCMAETFGPSRRAPENQLYQLLRPTPRDGFFTLDDKPGFGVNIDDKLLDAYTVDQL
jgi:L-rhamnonate dehydratase